MQVSVKRSGGYAGLTEQLASVDTARMGQDQRQRVEQLLRTSGLFDRPAGAPRGAVGADLFHYEITVRDGEREHTLVFSDDGGPETAPLRQLVQTLTQIG
jgi:hypothetical protein